MEKFIQRREIGAIEWSQVLDITNEYAGVIESAGWETGVMDAGVNGFHYIDSTAEARHRYQYRVITRDGSGNVSNSIILEATGYDQGIRGEIYDLMAIDKPYTILSNTVYAANKDESGVAIGWNYTDTLGVHHFIIYRSADGWPFKSYQSYLVYEGRNNPSETTDDAVISAVSAGLSTRYVVIDKGVRAGTTYKYKVVAKHLDGGFSEVSEVVSVTTSN